MAKSNGSDDVLDIGVEFGTSSTGKETARIGFKVSRDVLKLGPADKLLCGKQLQGRIVIGGKDNTPGQLKFDGMDDDVLEATFDCSRLGFNPDEITGGLTFTKSAIDLGRLARFSGASGRIVAACKGDIPEKQKHGEDEEDDERDLFHEDVEAGKNRPLGHPALTAAAKAHKAAKGTDREFLLGSPLTVLVPDIPAPWVDKLANPDKGAINTMGELLERIDAGTLRPGKIGFTGPNTEILKSAALAWRVKNLPAKDPTPEQLEAAYQAGCEAIAGAANPYAGAMAEAWAKGNAQAGPEADVEDVPDADGE